MTNRTWVALVVLCSSVGAAALAAAEPAGEDGAPNLRLSFTVGRIEAGSEVPLKSYEMFLEANGRRVELMTGARVPIPVTTLNADGDGSEASAVPVTSFTYQNVGFTAAVEARMMIDGKIRLSGQIEDSSITATGADSGRPIIQTLNQRIQATLEDGVPVRINKIEEANTRSLYVQVQAEVLRP